VKRTGTVIFISASILLAGVAAAQVTLDSARIGAKDPVALAKFYEAAFGMQEINRIPTPGGPEVFLNFGASPDAAKANKREPVLIMHRDSDDLKDPVPHLLFDVTDMASTVAAIKKNGGSMAEGPRPGPPGMNLVIGIAVDPVGNRMELIQRPQHQ
jgi:predicted enzyme related to lactoylglutathione lyase